MSSTLRLRRALVASLAIALVTGCGSSDSSTEEDQSITTPAVPDSATDTDVATDATSPLVELPVVSDGDPRFLFAVLTGAGGGLIITRVDGSDPVRLATDVDGVLKHPDWSPDGNRVAFAEEQSNTMWIASLDGSPSVRIPGCDGQLCDYPSWSPDGTKIAYSHYESLPGDKAPSASSIEIVDLASGEITTAVRLERPLLADVARWSPDGTQIVFGVDQMDDEAFETGAAVAVVPATGGEPTFLTDFALYGYAPDWNVDTDEIVFGTSVREFSKDFDLSTVANDVWVIRPDGTGLRQITDVGIGHEIRGPKWTPDGSQILAWSSELGAVVVDPTTGVATAVPAPPNTVSPRLRPT